ncbi:(2Fe-2S) ferredoxin domain-containing protein [Tenuifilum thalassicum]|uniref:(2Fe-2S) ferredoxin domain-containing protein n=1 Tax=Tenuifilum thalassicum TaxID=2590900 RepID=A0A7D3XE13_9BACT|nr:NAD(P)H-dependent oxidoreductase subunit E [Tenuifilum thalassicum]QKG79547.1 (2Fe-2S) ferredoxin domain-containing protein [Tenuifilum thalassicum]
MGTEKIPIVICLGSSCFSRGNRETLEVIKSYLKTKKIEDKVVFKGQLCTESCNKGPVIWINNQKFEAVTQNNVVSILNQALKSIL